MSTITKRALKNKEKVTSQVFFKRDGEANVIDLGNVTKCSYTPDVQRVEHFTAAVGDAGGGFAQADGKLVSTIAMRFVVMVDEIDNDLVRLLGLSDAATAANQAAAPSQAVTITDVEPGNSYDLGYRGITAQALTFGGTSKVENLDFKLNYKSGLLTILSSGAIVSGDDVAGTINVPAISRKVSTGITDMRVTGSATILQWDQFSESAPRNEYTISSAELFVTNWGESTHTGWREVTLELNCLVAPVVKVRQDT